MDSSITSKRYLKNVSSTLYIIYNMNSSSEGFYITLPNDSSKDFFPENKPWEYTTKLPQWIQLSGEWEISLHSITYMSWNIIRHLDEPIPLRIQAQMKKEVE